MKSLVISFFLVLEFSLLFGQVASVEELDQKYLNWYNKDKESSHIMGSSVDKAYEYLQSKGKKTKTVIVAVMDSGVDIDHEDLQGKIWVNEDEIAGNGIDDDNNGYVDDIHGWNFIGSSTGENISYENLEYARIVKKAEMIDPLYTSAKKLYDEELQKRSKDKEQIEKFKEVYEKAKMIIKYGTGIDVKNAEDLVDVQSNEQSVIAAKSFLQKRYEMGFTEEGLQSMIERNKEFLDYHLNLDFEPREMVGDDPEDISDRNYGNPDVEGQRADHGTSVAGLIAAQRDNGIGIDGIATDVRIMCIRSTPRGDERDKDVALGIYYAVDNGADIINMSFGKEFSPQKHFVDEAVKYAEEHGVLIVHGSGNSGLNIDEDERYPSDRLLDGSEPTNWINVGASAMNLDKQIAASFSNYGKQHVDVFAPGVDIISTDSSGTYGQHDGTSLAAPVVSGIAAMLLSYYPDLQPQEIIDIIVASSFQFKKPRKVFRPGDQKKVKFKDLSKSGGIINAYNAVVEAEKRLSNTLSLGL